MKTVNCNIQEKFDQAHKILKVLNGKLVLARSQNNELDKVLEIRALNCQ
jgi:hypothetical protein